MRRPLRALEESRADILALEKETGGWAKIGGGTIDVFKGAFNMVPIFRHTQGCL